MKKTVLIICDNELHRAPRVLKQISALKNQYKIITVGRSPADFYEEKFVPIGAFGINKRKDYNFHLKFPSILRKGVSFCINFFIYGDWSRSKKFRNVYWSNDKKKLLSKLQKLDFQLIIAHHPRALPIAVELKKTKKVSLIFNAHEYYPKEFENDSDWAKFVGEEYDHIFKTCFPFLDDMFSVCNGIQQEYLKNYGIQSKLIKNDKKFEKELEPSVVDANQIKMIHHGAAIRDRKIELMIELMNFLPDSYQLNLILLGDEAYIKELKEMSNNRVLFHDPVPVEQIAKRINQFDIGLFILPPVNFNWNYALPNKLFEFIQARLCIAVSPNPEMKSLVEDFELGIVSKDFSAKAMAEAIKTMSKDKITYFKNKTHEHAYNLSADKTEELIRSVVASLTK